MLIFKYHNYLIGPGPKICVRNWVSHSMHKRRNKGACRKEISEKLVTHLWTEISSAALCFSVCFPATSLPLDNNIIVSSAQHLCGQCSSTQRKTFKWGEDSELPGTESDGGCLTTEIQQNVVVPARHKSCLTSTYNVRTGEEGGKEERPSLLRKVCTKKPRRGRRRATPPAPESHSSFFPVTQQLRGENHYQKFWASTYSVFFQLPR